MRVECKSYYMLMVWTSSSVDMSTPLRGQIEFILAQDPCALFISLLEMVVIVKKWQPGTLTSLDIVPIHQLHWAAFVNLISNLARLMASSVGTDNLIIVHTGKVNMES